MRKLSLLLFAYLLIFSMSAAQSEATVFSYSFTGTIDLINHTSSATDYLPDNFIEINANDTFRGEISYEYYSPLIDVHGDTVEYGTFSPEHNFDFYVTASITIGNFTTLSFFDSYSFIEMEETRAYFYAANPYTNALRTLIDNFDINILGCVGQDHYISDFESGSISTHLYFLDDLGTMHGGGFISGTIDNFKSSPVPEPSTILLLGNGLIWVVWFGRKRKKT